MPTNIPLEGCAPKIDREQTAQIDLAVGGTLRARKSRLRRVSAAAWVIWHFRFTTGRNTVFPSRAGFLVPAAGINCVARQHAPVEPQFTIFIWSAGGLYVPAYEELMTAFRAAVDHVNNDRAVLPRHTLLAHTEKVSLKDSLTTCAKGQQHLLVFGQ